MTGGDLYEDGSTRVCKCERPRAAESRLQHWRADRGARTIWIHGESATFRIGVLTIKGYKDPRSIVERGMDRGYAPSGRQRSAK